MHLTDDDIRDFQALWREEFGQDLPVGELRQRILLLVELIVRVLRPLPPGDPADPDATYPPP